MLSQDWKYCRWVIQITVIMNETIFSSPSYRYAVKVEILKKDNFKESPSLNLTGMNKMLLNCLLRWTCLVTKHMYSKIAVIKSANPFGHMYSLAIYLCHAHLCWWSNRETSSSFWWYIYKMRKGTWDTQGASVNVVKSFASAWALPGVWSIKRESQRQRTKRFTEFEKLTALSPPFL